MSQVMAESKVAKLNELNIYYFFVYFASRIILE